MKINWLTGVFVLSFILLATLKAYELRQLKPFFRADRPIKLRTFDRAKEGLPVANIELLELWESMLTGRTAPVSRWIKDQYKALGLNHLFTPSGFHLSAVLVPLFKLIKFRQCQFWILMVLGVGIFQLAGQASLKRMILIKVGGFIFERKAGFIFAILLDALFGSFSSSPLSFTYSFLFLGIIYGGSKHLFLWFFAAQILLAYFTNSTLSPLLLVLSPLLNLGFALAMPLLFALAFPLWDWQLETGLFILKGLQQLVLLSGKMCALFPLWEVHVGILVTLLFVCMGKKKALIVSLVIMSSALNTEVTKIPGLGTKEIVSGKCKRELSGGLWWEKCSSLKRSTHKKLKKLSYLSEEQRMSSLHGSRTSSSV